MLTLCEHGTNGGLVHLSLSMVMRHPCNVMLLS